MKKEAADLYALELVKSRLQLTISGDPAALAENVSAFIAALSTHLQREIDGGVTMAHVIQMATDHSRSPR